MQNKNKRLFADWDFYRTPGYLLRRCHQRSHEIYNEICGKSGLTRQQFSLLLAVYHNPAASIQNLAEITAVDRNTLIGIIWRLTGKNYIEKRRSDSDARAYELHIRPEGIEILAEIEEHIVKVQQKILDPLDEKEKELFMLCLQKLIGEIR